MRLSVFMILAFGAMALTGAAWAEEPAKPATQAEAAAPAETPANPMGAGLVVPGGEEAFALKENEQVPVYAQPSLEAERVGVLMVGGNDNQPYQSYNVVKEERDPNWKETWWRKLWKKEAPVVKTTKPVSEFMLSPTQKGIMIINVQGSWLQIEAGWFQWTTTIAEHAEFKAWSELYQEASFASFQLSNAREGKADVVTLNAVPLQGVDGVTLPAGTKLMVLDARPEALAVRVTGGTCKGTKPVANEGAQGWVNLFANSGAPQIFLQPEQCPEDGVQ